MSADLPELTAGTLLGGAVQYRQPVAGYRTGIEPVLLAAWVPARGGDRVLEAGSGAGAGLLCLWRRVPDIEGSGLDIDPALVAVAQGNAAANGAALRFACGNVLAMPPLPPFDHAFSNPPWHDPAGTPAQHAARRRAKEAAPGLLGAWVRALAGCLRHRGTITLALPSASIAEAMAALVTAKLGSVAVLPLWPKAGRPAKLVLIRAVRDGKGAGSILPGLILHRPDGGYTPEAEAVLRGGLALDG